MKLLLFLINLYAVFALYPDLSDAKSDRIKLKDIQVLTFTDGKWTTGRRSSPIKQLRCVGGYCKRAGISTAQCYNRGFDGRDVQWECKANMPSAYKFGRMEVACEGYDYPEDDYVLAGSCGLEYSIEEVNGPAPGEFYSSQYNFNSKSDSENSPVVVVIFIVCFIVLIYFSCIHRSRRENDGPFPDDDNDGFPRSQRASAPPPPGFRNDYYDDSCHGSSTRNSSSTSGPGFYSGMAAGGLLGYLFGSGSSSRRRGGYTDTYTDSWSRPSTSSRGYSGYSGGSSTSSGFASTSRR